MFKFHLRICEWSQSEINVRVIFFFKYIIIDFKAYQNRLKKLSKKFYTELNFAFKFFVILVFYYM